MPYQKGDTFRVTGSANTERHAVVIRDGDGACDV